MVDHREFGYKGYRVVAQVCAPESAERGAIAFTASFCVHDRSGNVCWSRQSADPFSSASDALAATLRSARASIRQVLRRNWVDRMRTLPGTAFESTDL